MFPFQFVISAVPEIKIPEGVFLLIFAPFSSVYISGLGWPLSRSHVIELICYLQKI